MRPTFLDEQVGNDGKRYYNIVKDGIILYENVLLDKNYVKLQDGTKVASNIMINLLNSDNILNYKGTRMITSFSEKIIETIVDTENFDDIVLKKTTIFSDYITELFEYYQGGVVIYSTLRTTTFGRDILTSVV